MEVTDAKRANWSTLPCSGDKTHTESTHTRYDEYQGEE